MKLKVIDRSACRRLRDAIDKELVGVGKKFGVRIKAGNGSFDSGQVTFKVECAVIDANGEVQSKEVADFKRLAYAYGLQPTDLYREFNDFGGKRWRIIGCAARSRIYPIICELVTERANARRVKFTKETVKACLDKMK